ncbi:MAG: hypothetical protein ACOCW2_01885 [Chitinivibrionales bacterium]
MRHLWFIAAAILLCDTTSVQAKARVRMQHHTFKPAQGFVAGPIRQTLPQKLAPFIHARKQNRLRAAHQKGPHAVPSDADLFALARQWNALSPAFKQDYLAALSIPESMDVFISPSGHFEVYYTTEGSDAVSPVDTIGFSSADWRVRLIGANGVPDCVDEAGFALDSAWSMIIDRFGFLQPFAYTDDTHRSTRYKVVMRNLSEGYYGMTYPLGRSPRADVGYASFIEIRNEWQGWDLGDGLNYEKHPQWAIWITAAHEFFHAVQYRMVRDVDKGVLLDDFPVSWLEGTAVLMEDLAFPTINDYVQYTGSYFTDPGKTLLSDFYDGYDEYKNVLLTKFLYQNPDQADSIGLIRQTFFNNFQSSTPFYENLTSSAAQTGISWAERIGAFHGKSFFTGSRARSIFLDDAALFRSWDYSSGSIRENDSQHLLVNGHAMVPVSFIREPHQENALLITAKKSSRDHSSESAPLALSILLRDQSGEMQDTVIFRILDADTTVQIQISSWDHYQEALTIVSNTDLHTTQHVTISHKTDGQSFTPSDRAPKLVTDPAETIELVQIYTISGRLVSTIRPGTSPALSPARLSAPALRDRYHLATGSYLLHIRRRNSRTNASSLQLKRIMIK